MSADHTIRGAHQIDARILRCQCLVIVDEAGKSRALFGTDGEGGVSMQLLGANGEQGLSLTVRDGATLTLHDAQGKERLGVRYTEDSGVLVSVTGKYGDAQTIVYADANGAPHLAHTDPQGLIRALSLPRVNPVASLLARVRKWWGRGPEEKWFTDGRGEL